MVLAADPWTDILTFLQTLIVPAWGELINLLPFFVVVGVIGPIVTLLLLMQVWYLWHRRSGRVRRQETQPRPAPRDAAGELEFPPNVPYCQPHALLFPQSMTACTVDGAELTVNCPVDGTSRVASDQTCRACGTRYVLGATETPLTIRRAGQPPAGGAAVA